MSLPTPRWWYLRHRQLWPIVRILLKPASMVWASATALRIAAARPIDPGAPVICVGNLTLGGSGKTPVAREIARRLRSGGKNAHVLTRGYGGRAAGPTRVDVERHTAREVGDEALMMAADGPVWVARNRAAGASAARRAGAEVIVMDDGHQNGSIRKSLSLVVVDGETRCGEWPFGAGLVFPAGPLRESFSAGLARADAVVVLLPADLPRADPDLLGLFGSTEVLTAHVEPVNPPPRGRQIGFAGIAKPWRLQRALQAQGCSLAEFSAFGDHQILSESKLETLAARARDLGGGLVTSEKDWTRLSPKWRDQVTAWPVRVRFDDEQAIDRLLAGDQLACAGGDSLKRRP